MGPFTGSAWAVLCSRYETKDSLLYHGRILSCLNTHHLSSPFILNPHIAASSLIILASHVHLCFSDFSPPWNRDVYDDFLLLDRLFRWHIIPRGIHTGLSRCAVKARTAGGHLTVALFFLFSLADAGRMAWRLLSLCLLSADRTS